MQIDDVVRVKIDWAEGEVQHPGYMLLVTEVQEFGVNVVVMNGPHIGSEYYLPLEGRDFEVLFSVKGV